MKETAFGNPSVFSTEKVSDSYVIYKKMVHKIALLSYLNAINESGDYNLSTDRIDRNVAKKIMKVRSDMERFAVKGDNSGCRMNSNSDHNEVATAACILLNSFENKVCETEPLAFQTLRQRNSRMPILKSRQKGVAVC